jgi:hypothetical protein
MEDLAWQYPAEPVERAAVRFCEAIAKWRGKPELETVSLVPTPRFHLKSLTTLQYKKKPAPRMDPPQTPGGSTAMTIESLVHSNPTSPAGGTGAGSGNGSQQGQGQGSAERMRRLKKPSIDVYFMQMPMLLRRGSLLWSGGGGNKRHRDDDAGRPGPSKRMYPS